MSNIPNIIRPAMGVSIPWQPPNFAAVRDVPMTIVSDLTPWLETAANRYLEPIASAKLGLNMYEDCEPVQLWPDASDSEVEAVIQAVYRQVLCRSLFARWRCLRCMYGYLWSLVLGRVPLS